MPFTLTAAGIGLATTAYGMYNSYQEKEAAERAARKQGPYQDFTVTPEMRSVYSTATNDANNALGFTASETANFRNELANNTNTTMYNANRATGGNMSRYLARGLNTRNLGAINNFAAQDARLRVQNRNSALGRKQAAAGVMQGVSDRNTQAKNYRKMLIEQALGGAIAQQKQNFQQGIADIGQLGFTVAGAGLSRRWNSTPTTFDNTEVIDITQMPKVSYTDKWERKPYSGIYSITD